MPSSASVGGHLPRVEASSNIGLPNRPSTGRGNGVSCAGMPVPVVRQGVRGRHPDIAPDQTGPAPTDRLMAAAHVLHYGVGAGTRFCPQSADWCESEQISQDALRRAKGAVGDAYRKYIGAGEPFVHTDERAGEWEASERF